MMLHVPAFRFPPMVFRAALHRIVLALVLAGSATAALAASDPVLREVDAVRAPGSDFAFDANVVDSKGTRLGLRVLVRDSTKGLVRYVTPASSAGRSILYIGNNMWVYVPGTQRPLRISPKQQLIGGFSSADLARIVYAEDYEVVSSEAAGGGNTLLHLSGARKGGAYARIDLTVGKDNRPLQAEFFASSGNRKLKTLHFEGYKTVLGRARPTTLRVVDHLSGGAVTRLTYSNMRIEQTPASWYQPNFLSRLP